MMARYLLLCTPSVDGVFFLVEREPNMKNYIEKKIDIIFEFFEEEIRKTIDCLIETEHEIIIISLNETSFDEMMKLVYWVNRYYKTKNKDFLGDFRIIYKGIEFLENKEVSDINLRYWYYDQTRKKQIERG